MWNRPAPPGFEGLDSRKPLHVYYRNLPHWRQDGASYFVTFRLADSLPQCKLDELRQIKVEFERRAANRPIQEDHVTAMINDRLSRELFEKNEQWLDQESGRCLLRNPACAEHIIGAMHHFDGSRYELGCYVVMANHVHAIVRPLLPDRYALEELLGSWKKYSARRIREALGEQGELWQEESYDRIIRDEEHLWRVIQYIRANPLCAGVTDPSIPLWIRPEWVSLGWQFESLDGLGMINFGSIW
jgi:REP element-mobilizing transposase RayT